MKYIILFNGGIETQEYFSLQLAKEWEKMGYEIYWYNMALGRESTRFLREFLDAHKADEIVAFTFNHNGIAGEEGLYLEQKLAKPSYADWDDSWNLWDEYGIKVVNMVVDHPLYYHGFLNIHPKDYVHISIDKDHDDYIHRFFKDITKTAFIPLGGTSLKDAEKIDMAGDYLSLDKRPIDIIFTGNYTPKNILSRNLSKMDPEYVEFYENMVERILDNPELTVTSVAETAIREELGDIAEDDMKMCMTNLSYVDLCVRFYFRRMAIKLLTDAGLKVYMVGDGAEYMGLQKPDNLESSGMMDSRGCLELISQSKLSLNVMPWFKRGAHDRIFNSMLNGAVSLSDSSEYLDEVFRDGEDWIRYDLAELRSYDKGLIAADDTKLVRDVKTLLKDQQKIEEIGHRAYKKCDMSHSWRSRAKEIAKLF